METVAEDVKKCTAWQQAADTKISDMEEAGKKMNDKLGKGKIVMNRISSENEDISAELSSLRQM